MSRESGQNINTVANKKSVYKVLFYELGPPMDGAKKIMESLDSLWFFNNVLTLTTFRHQGHLTAAFDEADVVKGEEEEEEEEPAKDKAQSNSQDLQNEAPCSTEIWVPRCPKCGEIGVEFEQQRVLPVKEVEFAKPTEKQPGRRRRRIRKRSKRKVFGKLDFGFHGNLVPDSLLSDETNEGYGNFESQHYMKMPPLNDGLAMKEHLKSWAHAVACTVR